MEKIINFIVSEKDHKKRIDIILVNKFKDISRTKIKVFIKTKYLKINSILVLNPSRKVKKGEKVSLKIPIENKISLKPYDYNLDILFGP